MPAVLREDAHIFVAVIERVELALVVLAGHADQKVREVDAGLLAGEDEAAVELRDGSGIDLIGMELAAELHGVIAEHLREAVRCLIGVVDLDELICRGSGRIGIEVEIFDALPLGIESHDAVGSIRVHESLRSQADAKAADGLAEVGVVAHEAQVELVDHRRAEDSSYRRA